MSFGPYSRAGLALVFMPLYGGPVLAGWARMTALTLPVFAACFLLFIAASRKPDLRHPSGLAAFAIMALVQGALVALAFGAGLLGARLAGTLNLPLALPLLLTGAAALFGAWRYSERAEMDVFLDSAIAELEALNRRTPPGWDDLHPAPAPGVRRALDDALTALDTLPPDAGPGRIDPVVRALEQAAGPAAFDPLYDAAGEESGHDPRIDMALLRFAAIPRIRRALVQRGEGGLAPLLLLTATDPTVRAEARRLVIDLAGEGAPDHQLPPPALLAELDQRFPGEGYDRLLPRHAAPA